MVTRMEEMTGVMFVIEDMWRGAREDRILGLFGGFTEPNPL